MPKRKIRFIIIKYKHAPGAAYGVTRQELDNTDPILRGGQLLSAHPTRKEARETIKAMSRIFAPHLIEILPTRTIY